MANSTTYQTTTITSKAQQNPLREIKESIIIVLILISLFRTLEAEPFIIPTGSMAPNLRGYHKDLFCPECGHQFQTGASSERESANTPTGNYIIQGTCPNCNFPMRLNWDEETNHHSFSGDRIIVNKFAYQFSDPKRWDVIVFKYPGNLRDNYIKRLIGLPNETVKIFRGDIYTKDNSQKDGSARFQIARKPPHKVIPLLQLVHDNNHQSDTLNQAGWPQRWQPHSPAGHLLSPNQSKWQQDSSKKSFAITMSDTTDWIRYRHILPKPEDWAWLRNGTLPPDMEDRQGGLIRDFYAYNAGVSYNFSQHGEIKNDWSYSPEENKYESADDFKYQFHRDVVNQLDAMSQRAFHWVGDLALECSVTPEKLSGYLYLDLVEGGDHYQCQVDLATGKILLSINSGQTTFEGGHKELASQTTLSIGDATHFQFANIDDQLFLWIDGTHVSFDHPTTFLSRQNIRPKWTPGDAGDLAPVGIGAQGATLKVDNLKVHRDNYYVAPVGTVNHTLFNATGVLDGYYYEPNQRQDDVDYGGNSWSADEIYTQLHDYKNWKNASIFSSLQSREYNVGPDEFFPCGDNSPASSDARAWHSLSDYESSHYVRRKFLLGKAILVYWPHPWNSPIPYWPNPKQIRMIR
ncbi:MAG: signal peptidase I [Pirellulaceae bacterium]|nr:signal peptidase I [Pirellulaceae bacterium]